jgi:hypothetical protein
VKDAARSSPWCVGSNLSYFPERTPVIHGISSGCVGKVLPPPNVTGALHVGHALTVAIQARFHSN